VTFFSVLLAIGLLTGVTVATAVAFSAGLFLLARLEPAVVRPDDRRSRSVRQERPGR
jgi:hypothetical protein